MLLLIATPIGNLQDISARAREALASCDCMVCEDTRHTGLLYKILEIPPVPFVSLHKFNEAKNEELIIEKLRAGQVVGLVSDAGTPGICDPGAALVKRCHEEGIKVSIVPGPSASISSFAVSGSTAEKFVFCGFFPKIKGPLMTMLHEARLFEGDSIGYESPKRLMHTLQCVQEISPTWEVTLVRELSKVFEEIVRLPVAEMIARFKSIELQGECVLVLHHEHRVSSIPLEDVVSLVASCRERFHCSLKEAVELVASQERLPQRVVYQQCIAQIGT